MKPLLIIIFAITGMVAQAQELKTECKPSSCKPGNTKVEEAAVITNLRSDIQATMEQSGKFNNLSPIPRGADDQQSLEILMSEVNRLEKSYDLKQTDFDQWSGAPLVRELQAVINKLKY